MSDLSLSQAQMLGEFRHIVAGLGQDARIRLDTHDQESWAFDPHRRVVLVPTKGLDMLGSRVCAGILAHEIGHYYLSRYHLFWEAVDLSEIGLRLLLNAVEDSRTDHWMGLRYPGVVAWREQAIWSALARTPPPCAFLQFCAAAAMAPPMNGTCPWPDSPQAQDVNRALRATQDARTTYRSMVPDASARLDVDQPGLRAAFEREAAPLLSRGEAILARSPRETKVLLAAARAFVVFRDQLANAVAPLLAADTDQLARLFRKEDFDWSAMEARLRAKDASITASLLASAWSARGEEPPTRCAHIDELAREILAKHLSHDQGDRPSCFEVVDGASGQLPTSYEAVAEAVASQANTLLRRLLRDLLPSRRRRYGGGGRSGQRVDLRRAMASRFDLRQLDRVWLQPVRPKRPEAAVLLLVDLSGSMRGQKIEAAMACVVLIAEALHRSALDWAVAGFQDELIWIRRFEEPFRETVKRRVENMVLEVGDRCPGGLNHAEWNDDGPCLLEAAAVLEARPTDWRVLLVISDGNPEGRRSTPDDLRHAIRAVQRRGSPDVLVGIGAGPGTNHVRAHYPWAVANVPENELATQVASVVGRAVRARLGSRPGA